MSDIFKARSNTATPGPIGGSKLGPKGGVLEPYDRDVLLMAREGQSMKSIVDWLAEPPRSVLVTRQSVHAWVKRRIVIGASTHSFERTLRRVYARLHVRIAKPAP